MIELGYSLSSEEHDAAALVANARAAEEAGFTFALVSDHFHPWIDKQGHSPFVWSVIGAIARETESLAARHRRDVSTDPHPSGDRRAGGRHLRPRSCRAVSSSASAPART